LQCCQTAFIGTIRSVWQLLQLLLIYLAAP